MSLSTVLQGEIRKTKLESLIKCCLDDSHKELQTVLQQGVDGRDESRCAGSCNRAPSSCTGVHQDYIHLSIKALMLCCTLQSLVLDPAMNTCHGLVPVRLRCHKHTQLIHYETRAAFPLCRPFHIEGVTFSTCIHRLGMLSRCHVHIHNKSDGNTTSWNPGVIQTGARTLCRAQALLKFVHGSRQRLLRVRVLLTHPIRMRHVGACKSIEWLTALERHQHMLSQASDTLYHNHQFFSYAIPVPIFDVASALTIRSRGYLPLPACIGQLDSVPKPPTGRKRVLLETEANALVYRLLHQTQWPPGLTLIEV